MTQLHHDRMPDIVEVSISSGEQHGTIIIVRKHNRVPSPKLIAGKTLAHAPDA